MQVRRVLCWTCGCGDAMARDWASRCGGIHALRRIYEPGHETRTHNGSKVPPSIFGPVQKREKRLECVLAGLDASSVDVPAPRAGRTVRVSWVRRLYRSASTQISNNGAPENRVAPTRGVSHWVVTPECQSNRRGCIQATTGSRSPWPGREPESWWCCDSIR